MVSLPEAGKGTLPEAGKVALPEAGKVALLEAVACEKGFFLYT